MIWYTIQCLKIGESYHYLGLFTWMRCETVNVVKGVTGLKDVFPLPGGETNWKSALFVSAWKNALRWSLSLEASNNNLFVLMLQRERALSYSFLLSFWVATPRWSPFVEVLHSLKERSFTPVYSLFWGATVWKSALLYSYVISCSYFLSIFGTTARNNALLLLRALFIWRSYSLKERSLIWYYIFKECSLTPASSVYLKVLQLERTLSYSCELSLLEGVTVWKSALLLLCALFVLRFHSLRERSLTLMCSPFVEVLHLERTLSYFCAFSLVWGAIVWKSALLLLCGRLLLRCSSLRALCYSCELSLFRGATVEITLSNSCLLSLFWGATVWKTAL